VHDIDRQESSVPFFTSFVFFVTFVFP